MRSIRFSCRLALPVLLFMLFVPAEFANASGQLMFSGGGALNSLNGDIAEIHLPATFMEISIRGIFDKGKNVVSPFFKLTGVYSELDTTSHKDTKMYGLVPSFGVNLDLWRFNVYAMAGFGPYTYDEKWSGMADLAVGLDFYVFNWLFLTVTNHADYMLGFYHLSYRLMGGIGISFGRHTNRW